MSDVLIDQDTMEDIGDSIRSKLGVQTTYLPSEMPNAIMSISGGGGGGSAKYSETVLWSGAQSATGTITLSESVKNFSIIMLMISAHPDNTNYYKIPWYILVSEITDYTTKYQFEPFGIRGATGANDRVCMLSLHFTNETSILIDEASYGSQAKPTLLKVIGIKWETMQTALIYSEEEREVGVWIDGKPLYQKTFIFVNVTTLNSWVSTNHNISNIDKITNYDAIFTRISDNWTIKTDHYEGSSTAYISSNADKTQIRFKIAISSGTYNGSFTIWYTKTTDTAGSGIWTTTGEYAHHYSTNEHIVGTWVDGSTLYEKTIVINNPASGGDWVEYDIGVPNLNKVIKQEGTWDRDVGSSGIWTYDLNAVNELSLNNNYIVNARIRNGTKKLAVYVGSQYSCPQLRFTFQYTKTT